ncbi:response regulator [candidate division KSB1 bacterium]|nr:response regulator [candidate division KSB1 bacterium]
MCRVLLVDDEKNVLMTLAIGLQRNDFSVEKAQNGPQALEMLKKNTFDFVVSDIRMLPMDGYTLALKIHKQYPEVRIVLMSAYGFEAKRHKKGFAQLTKPFEMSDLVQLLHQEDEKRKHARMNNVTLFLAEVGNENAKVLSMLEKLDFQVNQVNTEKALEKELDKSNSAMILIDEAFLNDDRWKVLNIIDKHESQPSVVILVDKKHDSNRGEDSGITSIDRARFVENPKWASDFLTNRMGLSKREERSQIK